jgi:hypothetical protein
VHVAAGVFVGIGVFVGVGVFVATALQAPLVQPEEQSIHVWPQVKLGLQ